MITVWVAYALPDRQWLREVMLPAGSTVEQAIAVSGVTAEFPAIDPPTAALGIFGRPASLSTELREGDRVEIYRPLNADPKETRRRRAARQARR